MNALELADFLDMYFSCNQPASNALCDAATMLRKLDGQLAFRIDAVTRYQAKVEEQQAEIEALKAENSHLKYEISSGAWNPEKELTDEEKWEVFTNLARSPDLRADMIRFADSILRKAQEK